MSSSLLLPCRRPKTTATLVQWNSPEATWLTANGILPEAGRDPDLNHRARAYCMLADCRAAAEAAALLREEIAPGSLTPFHQSR